MRGRGEHRGLLARPHRSCEIGAQPKPVEKQGGSRQSQDEINSNFHRFPGKPKFRWRGVSRSRSTAPPLFSGAYALRSVRLETPRKSKKNLISFPSRLPASVPRPLNRTISIPGPTERKTDEIVLACNPRKLSHLRKSRDGTERCNYASRYCV